MVKKLFGVDYSYNFNDETTIIDNIYIKVTVKLEYEYKYKYKSLINLVIKDNKAVDVNLGDFWNIIEELKKVINFNLDDIKTKIELSYSEGMSNGSVNVIFHWLQKKIEISAGSKITKDHDSFRGGYTITIYLKNDMNKKKQIILEPCYVFLKRLGKAGELVTNFINSIVNDIIQIIIEVMNNLNKLCPSLLSAFLAFILCFTLSFA